MGRRLPLSIGLSIGLLLGLAPGLALAATVRVDDDGKASAGSCDGPAKAPKTPQAGVNAAAAGDVVVVCPGTYAGSVTITGKKDGLTLKGTAATKVFVKEGANTATVRDLIKITSTADRITIQGLTLRAIAGDCETRYAINSTGRDVTIKGVRILGRDACFSMGIVLDQAATGSATASTTVSGTTIKDVDTIGILLGGDRASATIKNNTIRWEHLERFPSASRRHTIAPAGIPSPTGVAVERDAAATITGNTISSAGSWQAPETTVGLAYGVRVRNTTGVVVQTNTISGTGEAVSVTVGSADVLDNTISDSYLGIGAYGLKDSTISGNTVSDVFTGILLTTQLISPPVESTGNTVSNNTMAATTGDCTDDSYPDGSLTLLTKNTWTGNVGALGSDYPDGICPAAS